MHKIVVIIGTLLVGLILLGGCASKEQTLPDPVVPGQESVLPKKEQLAVLPKAERVRLKREQQIRDFCKRLSPLDQDMSSWTEMRPALLKSLEYVERKPESQPAFQNQGEPVTWGQLAVTLRHMMILLKRMDDDPTILANYFEWVPVKPVPLMTGYYAPELEASLVKHPDYPYPIYGPPKDMKTISLGKFHPRWKGQKLYYTIENGQLRPYYDREDIDLKGALAGKGQEIAWAKDPWDIYHLQVQGSGYLRLPDGTLQPILYAGKNGREFKSISGKMLRDGMIEKKDLHREGIRQALDKLGPRRLDVLAENPSYVFFRLADSEPVGSMGKPLTGMVSMATDPKVLPHGTILPFSADLPTGPNTPRKRVWGIGLSQDTGGVIKGARIDYYCGSGRDKEYIAFRIKNPVTTYILLSKLALSDNKPAKK